MADFTKSKDNKGWLLMTTGERIRIEGKFTLAFLQKMVSGPGQTNTDGGNRSGWATIEVLKTEDGEQMIVNEEGKMLELAHNSEASSLLHDSYFRQLPEDSPGVLGDVVVVDAGFEIE